MMKNKNRILFQSDIFSIDVIYKALLEIKQEIKKLGKNKIYGIFIQIKEKERTVTITQTLYIDSSSKSVRQSIKIIEINFGNFILKYTFIQNRTLQIIGREYITDHDYIQIQDDRIRKQVVKKLFSQKQFCTKTHQNEGYGAYRARTDSDYIYGPYKENQIKNNPSYGFMKSNRKYAQIHTSQENTPMLLLQFYQEASEKLSNNKFTYTSLLFLRNDYYTNKQLTQYYVDLVIKFDEEKKKNNDYLFSIQISLKKKEKYTILKDIIFTDHFYINKMQMPAFSTKQLIIPLSWN